MNEIDTEISVRYKDILQKYTSGLFRNAILEYYGIKSAKIKELINVELPVVEVADTSTDFIFLLEDDTYMHFEFQTGYSRDDLIRFAEYDLRLYKRDRRKIQTVVIYSSDVREAADTLDIGSLVYAPVNIMMYKYDGNVIFRDLETKLKARQDLSDTDMLNIILLPLMRNTIPKAELAVKAVRLAQTIENKNKSDLCVASAIAFSSKYLNNDELSKIWEVFRMTDVIGKLIKDEVIEIAKKAIRKGLSLDDISDLTNLDIAFIEELKEEVEANNMGDIYND